MLKKKVRNSKLSSSPLGETMTGCCKRWSPFKPGRLRLMTITEPRLVPTHKQGHVRLSAKAFRVGFNRQKTSFSSKHSIQFLNDSIYFVIPQSQWIRQILLKFNIFNWEQKENKLQYHCLKEIHLINVCYFCLWLDSAWWNINISIQY